MLAFLPSLGWQEMFLLLVIGLLLYGRNLPDAGRKLGRVVAQLKRSFDEFKRQIDADADLREVKQTVRETADDLRRAGEVPRAIANPVSAAKALAREAMLAPPPDAITADAAPSEPASQPPEEPRG
ncbi:MAG: twin-arginine translocase TatA/TatE family subunit [Planctomycetes bacterium]|nr:twin-arginine translocase TatA/TatE family subunit [Planctomycetota bacterium]